MRGSGSKRHHGRGNGGGHVSYASLVCFTILNLAVLLLTAFFWLRRSSAVPQPFQTQTQTQTTSTSSSLAHLLLPASEAGSANNALENVECNDPVWCNVPIPGKSHYKFDTPIDPRRWRHAQLLAARGDQVLLDRIIRVFPNHFDYLDGDRSFRKLHSLMDIFVDHKSGLYSLTKKGSVVLGVKDTRSKERRRRLADAAASSAKKSASPSSADDAEEDGDEGDAASEKPSKSGSPAADMPGHVEGKRVVPEPYNYRAARRAPIIQMGYFGFLKNLNTFFSGNFIGGNFIKKGDFLREWARLKKDIDVPFITVCALNENWGLLSTMFPNRTAAWGQCCDPAKEKLLYEFLNHDKTLLLITNQHNNISHPKLLTIPRGIPLTWQFTAKLMWDSQRLVLRNVKKTRLLFAASSNWGARGQMIRCISSKFNVEDFEGHSSAPTIQKSASKIKTDRRHYYEKLGGVRFGLALPGLGYDCFRTWELLTMGTIVVLEKAVGLDRTVRRRLSLTSSLSAHSRHPQLTFSSLLSSILPFSVAVMAATCTAVGGLQRSDARAASVRLRRGRVPRRRVRV